MVRNGRIIALAEPDAFRESEDAYVQAFLKGEVPEDEEEEVL